MSDRSLFSVSRRVVVLRLGATALGLAVLTGAPACASGAKDKNIVYKTPTCGCCTAWTEHLKGAGFDFRIVEVDDLSETRKALGAPPDLASCHVARIGGYVIEGHVPADAIAKLLAAPQDAIGLFVPGMPLGSPGMEGPYPAQPFDVILLRRDGSRQIFASYAS